MFTISCLGEGAKICDDKELGVHYSIAETFGLETKLVSHSLWKNGA